MTSTPAARIWSPPMPKISTFACFFNSAERRAAYMSPLASPAESRICVGGIEKKEFSRLPVAAKAVRKMKRYPQERAAPAPCIEAGKAGNKFRAGQEAPDGLPVRATCLCERQECDPRAESC